MSRKKCGRVDCPQKLGYSWAEGNLGQKCWDPHWQIKGADKLANSQVLIYVAMVTLGLVRVSASGPSQFTIIATSGQDQEKH